MERCGPSRVGATTLVANCAVVSSNATKLPLAYSRDIDRWNMVWKQDLAKLKQTLKEGDPAPPPPPKAKPKPLELKPLDDEDALFLSAMGLRQAAAPRKQPEPRVGSPAPAAPAATPVSGFEEALKDLKGLKPLASDPILAGGPAVAPAQAPAPAAAEILPEPPAPPILVIQELPPVPISIPILPSPQAHLPVRIQLAAGMAVEVDGSLDLRHHSVRDSEERLKDRLEDAVFLAWRTLHVQLGPDEALHRALQHQLDAGALPMVTRYAQAPVPMGGAHAWILYLSHPEA